MKTKYKIGISMIGIVALFFIIYLSTAQVMYSQTVDNNIYTQYEETSAEMYMNGYIILTPKPDEQIYFELRLISPDVSSGENRPLGMLEYGVVEYGQPYQVGCWWGNDGDYSKDCSIYVKYYHKTEHNSGGGSCNETWQVCDNGYDCKSGVCVSNAECSQDSQCSDGGFDGSAYCYSGNVVKDFNDGYCSTDGSCGYNTIRKVQQTCDSGCSDGACVVQGVTPTQNETCVEGAQRETSQKVYVCDKLTPVKEICSGNKWQELTYSNTGCEANVSLQSITGNISTSKDSQSQESDVDWKLISIVIVSAGAIIGAILFITNYLNKRKPKRKHGKKKK